MQKDASRLLVADLISAKSYDQMLRVLKAALRKL